MTNLYRLYGKNLPYTYFNEILSKPSGSSDLYPLSVMLSGCWRVIASPAHWQVRYPFLVGGWQRHCRWSALFIVRQHASAYSGIWTRDSLLAGETTMPTDSKVPQFTLRKPYIRIRKSWLTLHQYMLFYFLSNCKNSLSFAFSFLDGRVLQSMNLWPPKF